MKILINTATTYRGGGVQVALSFIEECRKHNGFQYHVILSEKLTDALDQCEYPDNFSFYKIPYRPSDRVFSLKSPASYFKELEKKISPDVVFTTSGPAYWKPGVPHLTGYNLPHYIYPDSPYFNKISTLKRLKWYLKGKIIQYYFKHDTDRYVVQTDDVNQRLRKLLGTDNVDTVTNTCSSYYMNPARYPDKLFGKKEEEFRLLALSAWYGHKNLGIIPEVIRQLPSVIKNDIKFVLTLSERDLYENFPEESLAHIVNTGPVPPQEGASLYLECDALFLPTLLECFSASYPEAMAMKKPILTSDLGFSRSICKNAALYFDPVDPVDIAEKITTLYHNHPLRDSLVIEGEERLKEFETAEGRAMKYLKICESMVK